LPRSYACPEYGASNGSQGIVLELNLSDFEVRVLGSLAEKAFLTPDTYPLSLNAVTMACNQVSNRDPVMQLTDDTVQQTLTTLREKKLVREWFPTGSRVPKFDHVLQDVFGLGEAQLASLTLLMLRGPQTAGEIKGRSNRMHTFHEVERVEATMQSLMSDRETPLVMKLPKAPGTKEARYAHLLSGQQAVERQGVAGSLLPPASPTAIIEAKSDDRVSMLEDEVQQLRAEVSWLSRQFDAFKKQFE
jgi:uncharacterized protein